MLRCGAIRSTLSRQQQRRQLLPVRSARGFADDGGSPATDGDARHREFSKRFVEALREAKTEPPKSPASDAAAADADKELAAEIARLFDASKVKTTPELLKRREQLRAEYPELFKGISDRDLDG
ncbi:hypothetical protein IWQ56_003673 [Coemansia nantahalensis]|nr:hypothetical protein IWQ56_003673 [Coemansia nantahalensis]